MASFDDDRRVFLARLLAAGGFALVGGRLSRAAETGDALAGAAPKAIAPAPVPPGRSTVWEIHFASLRDEAGRIHEIALQDFVMVAASALTGERFPLDGLSELFHEEDAATVLVDARSGNPRSRALATKLATSIAEVANDRGRVRILDASDDDLVAGGYTVTRSGAGPFVHGTSPRPGYSAHLEIEGPKVRSFPLSKAAASANRLAVVASLGVRQAPASQGGVAAAGASPGRARMAPFVIDAALRILDERSRKIALEDPSLGARILARPEIAGKMGMVVGEAVEMPLGDAGESADPSSKDFTWRADEVIAGANLFAVERIGHRILSNTRAARGLPPVDPHPILVAAEEARLEGASMSTIAWKKGAL